jgi:hypothetical protein
MIQRTTAAPLFRAMILFSFATAFGAHAASSGDELPPPTGAIVDYSVVQDIFNRRCLECHEGDDAPNELTLIDIRSYTLIVDEASHEVPSLKRVKPGSSKMSYLFQKINTPVPKSGSRMPIGFVLPVEEQVAIRDWIDQGALPLNRNPSLVSGPSATPEAPRVGEGVRFSVEANDPNGDPLEFAWTFGDGTSASGASVVHTYAAAGMFSATVSITDGRTGLREATLDLTVSADSDTDGDGIPNLSDADDDNDGFTDAIELAAGSDPLDAASTPLGGSSATPQTLVLAQAKVKLSYKKPDTDGLSAKLSFSLSSETLSPAQQFYVDLGGIVLSGTPDAKGSLKTETLNAKLKSKKQRTGGVSGELSLRVKGGDFSAALLGLQLASAADADEAALPRTVSLFFGGMVYTAQRDFYYKRRKGGNGAAGVVKE